MATKKQQAFLNASIANPEVAKTLLDIIDFYTSGGGNDGHVISVNGEQGVVTLSSDDILEGVLNKYFTTTRARTAAVVNSTAGSQIDQAASVAAMKSFILSSLPDLSGYYTKSEVDFLLNAKADQADLDQEIQDRQDADALLIPLAEKGANNGVATLDAGGKIPTSQLPNSIMTYEGTWDASTNTPTLVNGTGNAGMVYLTAVAGTVDFGAGPITFALGDWAVYSGTIWESSVNSNSVVSVNGQQGIVSLDTDDIPEGANKYYSSTLFDADFNTKTTDELTEGIGNLYFTDARALDALAGTVSDIYDAIDAEAFARANADSVLQDNIDNEENRALLVEADLQNQIDVLPNVTLTAVGSTPNANAASITAGQVLNLQPANGSFPGVITTAAQTIAGVKTFTSDPIINTADIQNISIGNQFAHNSSTGVVNGGILSINTDPTKFDLSAGSAIYVDYTIPATPTIKTISWAAFTAQTVTGLAVQDQTYIMVSNLGAIVQLSSYPTPAQRRTNAFIGRIGHSNRSSVQFANSFPDISQSVSSQIFDFMDALGSFNVTGNICSSNGATLTFQKSAGTLFFRSFNYPTNTQQPHTITVPSATPVSFAYRTSTALIPGANTNVLVGNYDVGGTVTAIPGAGARTVIHRIFLAPNGVVQIQYGSNFYTNLAEGLANIATDPFTINPALADVTVLIGYIVAQKNATALNDLTRVAILPAGRFSTGASGGVNTVTSLQQSYNSSNQPEIVLDSTHGGLDIVDNTTPLGTTLFTVKDNTGATNYLSVSASGITASQIIDSGLTGDTVPYANGSKQLTSSVVTPTELGYLSGASSNIQTQITTNTTNIGNLVTLSGVAVNSTSLGTFTGAIIPDSSTVKAAIQSLESYIEGLSAPFYYSGTWSAATNTPALANTDVGVQGKVYYVTAAGSVNFGAGAISFEIGDKVANNGTTWDKWDMTDSVASVNGQVGSVVLTTSNIAEGSNLYYTDERSQDSIGTILVDTNTIDFTYNDSTPSIVADVRTQMTITSDSSGIKLVNDSATPGNIKYYGTNGSGTKGYYDIPAIGSAGDFQETSFSAANNVSTPTNVTGFAFANGVVRSFKAMVSVSIDATSDLFEEFEIRGIQKSSNWDITISELGDDSGVSFTITTLGQIQYTSTNLSGFVTNTMKFRAWTTSI